jgi:hypothetical protein
VTIAKRVWDLADLGQVLVIRTVAGHLVGSGISFEDGGKRELKGVPGVWRLFMFGCAHLLRRCRVLSLRLDVDGLRTPLSAPYMADLRPCRERNPVPAKL